MSTTSRGFDTEHREIEVMTDSDAGTVTFVADRHEDGTVAPTEWLTADADSLVDVESHR
jgi:hypothetical protein